jgi:nucleoside diphosphate kinase
MALQQILLLIKPLGVEADIELKVKSILHNNGFKESKPSYLNGHGTYVDLNHEPIKLFNEDLKEESQQGPFVAMIVKGENATSRVKDLLQDIMPFDDINDYIHTSVNEENAQIEIERFMPKLTVIVEKAKFNIAKRAKQSQEEIHNDLNKNKGSIMKDHNNITDKAIDELPQIKTQIEKTKTQTKKLKTNVETIKNESQHNNIDDNLILELWAMKPQVNKTETKPEELQK